MKWSLYALFAVMPLTQVTVGGHVLLLEIVLLGVVFAMLMSGENSGAVKRILFLDVVIIVYAVFNLVSVGAGGDDWYVSMRYYRWNVLAPVIIYFVLRKAHITPQVMKYGLLFLTPGMLVQAAMFIHYYITYGVRPEGVEGVMYSTITLSAIFAVGTWVLLFLRTHVSGKTKYVIVMSSCAVLFAALIISFTRMAIISFVIFTPVAHRLWMNMGLRRYASYAFMIFIGAFVAVIMASSVAFEDVYIEDEKEVQTSIERVYNIDLYIKDLTGRLAFWGRMAKIAMDNPVLGTGGAGYSVGTRGGTAFHLGSVHNVLISSLIVGGVPGLVIFMLLIWGTYKCLNSIPNDTELVTSLGKILWCSYTMLILIAITNDVTGARILHMFFLMGLIANLSLLEPGENDDVDENKREHKEEKPARVLYARR